MYVLNGEKIKQQRENLKLTQTDIFKATNFAITPSELSKIETGKKTTLISSTLAELAKALGLVTDDIMQEVTLAGKEDKHEQSSNH